MEFIISYQNNSGRSVIPEVISPGEDRITVSGGISITIIEARVKLYLNRLHSERYEFLIFGDLIFNTELRNNEKGKIAFLEESISTNSIHKLKGFFYIIAIFKVSLKVEVHSSLFNILPVYYFQDESTVLISPSVRNIINYAKSGLSFSERYAVEKLLFNYSFGNRTLYNEISLLPSCSYIEIGIGTFSIKKSYSPYDLYVSNPDPWRKSLDKLSDLFLNEFKNYLPEDPATISLTGGFDGRALLSAAIKFGYIPETFSYGTPFESDILIPQKIADSLNFPHSSFLLTREYARESFWNDGVEFLEKTDFSGNISRAHYVHVAKALSNEFKYMLSGNFGSELFRSMKSPGVMASPAIFALFQSDKKEDFEKYIMETPSLRYLNEDILRNNLSEIIDEVWHYKLQIPVELSANQKFYTYIFEEVFRKYFGPEIIFQSDYLINRSPFLDFHFIEELLKTKNAGVYYRFNENNPFSRFHGQVLYSHIIKKSCNRLLVPLLDKGYRPGDFLTVSGKIRILYGYFKRKIQKSRVSEDPLYSKYYYQENLQKIVESIGDFPYLNIDYLKGELENDCIPDQTVFANVLSLYLSYGKKI